MLQQKTFFCKTKIWRSGHRIRPRNSGSWFETGQGDFLGNRNNDVVQKKIIVVVVIVVVDDVIVVVV
jgi:hypothetical protein